MWKSGGELFIKSSESGGEFLMELFINAVIAVESGLKQARQRFLPTQVRTSGVPREDLAHYRIVMADSIGACFRSPSVCMIRLMMMVVVNLLRLGGRASD